MSHMDKSDALHTITPRIKGALNTYGRVLGCLSILRIELAGTSDVCRGSRDVVTSTQPAVKRTVSFGLGSKAVRFDTSRLRLWASSAALSVYSWASWRPRESGLECRIGHFPCPRHDVADGVLFELSIDGLLPNQQPLAAPEHPDVVLLQPPQGTGRGPVVRVLSGLRKGQEAMRHGAWCSATRSKRNGGFVATAHFPEASASVERAARDTSSRSRMMVAVRAPASSRFSIDRWRAPTV